MPKFAVLTPTLPERKSLLEECAASVAAQTTPAAHLVGTDESRQGPGPIRNQLAAVTDAEWLLPLDDDDLLDPDYIETLEPFLDGADVVYPWCRVEGVDDWCPNRLFRPDALLRFNFIPVTALVRKEMFDRVGGFRPVSVEDWNLWLRLMGAGARFRCVDEVLWTYRATVSGESRNQWRAA